MTLCELSRCILDISQSGRDSVGDMCLLTLEPISLNSMLREFVFLWFSAEQSLGCFIAPYTVSLFPSGLG